MMKISAIAAIVLMFLLGAANDPASVKLHNGLCPNKAEPRPIPDSSGRPRCFIRAGVSVPAIPDRQAQPSQPEGQKPDDLSTPEHAKAVARFYGYLVEQMDHSRNSYEWQLWSTKTIFVIVLLLVACGVGVSLLQILFGLGFFEPRRRADGDASLHGQRVQRAIWSKTKIKIGIEGAEVETQIAGIVLLMLSLAFFYLYVQNVYPIRVSSQVNLPLQQGGAASIPLPGGAGSAATSGSSSHTAEPAASPSAKPAQQ